jgi:hypothetical protein
MYVDKGMTRKSTNPGMPVISDVGPTRLAQDMLDTVVMLNSRSLMKERRSGVLAGFTRCTSIARLVKTWYSNLS